MDITPKAPKIVHAVVTVQKDPAHDGLFRAAVALLSNERVAALAAQSENQMTAVPADAVVWKIDGVLREHAFQLATSVALTSMRAWRAMS